MTANQINWLNLQEQRRANVEREMENRRANQAKEAEAFRSNLESERLRSVELAERERSNRAQEELKETEQVIEALQPIYRLGGGLLNGILHVGGR